MPPWHGGGHRFKSGRVQNIMTNVNIVLARDNHLGKIAQIYMKAFNNAGFGEKWTSTSSLNFIRYMFKRQRDLFFIAVSNDQVIGGCVGVIGPFYDGNNLVDIEVFVDPYHQNEKIGKKLLQHLISEAVKKYNITVVSLHTYRHIDFPFKWYNRIGLRESNLVYLEGIPQEILSELK